MQLRLENVSLVCIDNIYPELAYRAIKESSKNISYQKKIFFTSSSWIDVNQNNVDAELLLIRIDNIDSIEKYSGFVLKELIRHINTEFILLVQWDGYVTDYRLWSNDFFSHDYIGASWNKNGIKMVGNGGFSLRSKKLLEAYEDSSYSPGHPEDEMLCIRYKDSLEKKYLIQYAQVEIANIFSFEDDSSLAKKTFGFHGFFNIPLVSSLAQLSEFINLMPPSIFSHGHLQYFVGNITKHRPDSDIILEHLFSKIRKLSTVSYHSQKNIVKSLYKNNLYLLSMRYVIQIIFIERKVALGLQLMTKVILFKIKTMLQSTFHSNKN